MAFGYNFKGYKISYTPKAKKELKAIDYVYAKKIEQKLEDMVKGSQNSGILIQLKGIDQTFRLVIGDYRALFEVNEKIITIIVISVKHRKDVYERL